MHAHTIENTDKEWLINKKISHETASFSSSNSIIHILRLQPNEDILNCIYKYCLLKKIKSASIISTVGSLKTTNIRYANQENGTSLNGFFEIVSLVGNIDQQSDSDADAESGHIHISVSNEYGMTIGGHALQGNIVYTTAEITILEMEMGIFSRQLDIGPNGSGYQELKVHHVQDEL